MVQEVSKKQPATAALDQALIFFNFAVIHPPPQYPILLRIPHLSGAQVYGLKRSRRAQHFGDPKFPKLTQTPVLRASANPSYPQFLKITHVASTARDTMPLPTELSVDLSLQATGQGSARTTS